MKFDRRLLTLVFAAIIAFFVFRSFCHYQGAVAQGLSRIQRGRLCEALAICIVYRLLNSCGWGLILRGLNCRVSPVRASLVWLTSEACRWVPGTIWSFGSRLYQASNLGISAAVASASLPLELVATIAAWSFTAAWSMWWERVPFALPIHDGRLPFYLACAALAPFSVVFLMRAGGAFARISRAPSGRKIQGFLHDLLTAFLARPRPAWLGASLVYYCVLCSLNGVAFWMTIRAVAPSSFALSLPAAVCANAAGWLAGIVAIGAPGGIVVREAAAAIMLGAFIPAGEAVTAVLVWRLLMIIDEICCLVFCLALKMIDRSPLRVSNSLGSGSQESL